MKSMTLPSFWEKYYLLDTTIKQQAKKVYGLWLQNPSVFLSDELTLILQQHYLQIIGNRKTGDRPPCK